MRRRWTFLAVATITTILVVPGQAVSANGGAYLELDKAHYLPGEHGTAVTYVTVPERRESIFDLGPFYLYALPDGTFLREDRPIPEGAVRIGTFAVEEERHQFELTAEFTVPQLASRSYSLEVCNEPCTVSGFREALSGSISIVATEREAELLNRNSRLSDRMWHFRYEFRRAERRLERAQEDFEWELTNERAVLEDQRATIEQLEAELAAARARAAEAAGSPVDPWVIGGGIVAAAALAAALLVRRRRSAAGVRLTPLPLEVGTGHGNGNGNGKPAGVPTGSSAYTPARDHADLGDPGR
jgi:hypothetical protein